MNKSVCLLFLIIICLSCGDSYVPKPKGYLRLDYPKANYVKSNLEVPFTFENNVLASKIESKSVNASTKSYGINLEYPSLKGTIFLTYKAVENNRKNLVDFLRDAQNFTQKHNIKADAILENAYENPSKKAYGMFYQVEGDAASQAQFYLTDSINHFLTGSLYFNARPNYDSILPAANYLQKDIKHIMETVEWK